MTHALDDDAACRLVLEYLAIRNLRIHDRLSQISTVSEYFQNPVSPPVLFKQPNKKAARIIPAACFLNANAQTPAWPLLAGPPPTVDDDIARNVHGRTVSVQCVRLQPENSATQMCHAGHLRDKVLQVSQKKIRTVWGCPDFLRTGINETEGMGRFLQFQTPPYPMPKFTGAI